MKAAAMWWLQSGEPSVLVHLQVPVSSRTFCVGQTGGVKQTLLDWGSVVLLSLVGSTGSDPDP